MSEVKERPILFSGAMVRAILKALPCGPVVCDFTMSDGRKTQTRRVAKMPKGELATTNIADPSHQLEITAYGDHKLRLGGVYPVKLECPYGRPGERLWVREAWAHFEDFKQENLDPYIIRHGVAYRAWHQYGPARPERWRPSIHMPRWASRITLEVVAVRAERLHDISEADAIAEGVRGFMESGAWVYEDYVNGGWVGSAKASFLTLWESINGKESLAANPLVWVVEFRKLEAQA